jgi:hypothetical protein
MILIPSKKILEPNRELMLPPVGLRGFYKIEAVRPDGRRRLLADWFPNLITDAGLELIGGAGGYFLRCVVGSGNTAPSNSDTALVSLVGSTTSLTGSTQTAQSTPPYFGTLTMTYRFNAGVATGNLAEVGIGPTNTNLFSRALILDGGGSPTTITVLSGEALDVSYQLQLHSPTVDVTGSVTISGVATAYTLRAATVTAAGNWAPSSSGDPGGPRNLTVYNGTIGAVTTTPSGSTASAPVGVPDAYSAGSHRRDSTFSLGLVDGNVSGGVSAISYFCGLNFGDLGVFQVGFSPTIAKDSTKLLTLSLRHSWARFP